MEVEVGDICLFCADPMPPDSRARYCSDWCRAQQAAANDAPPLPGRYEDVSKSEWRAIWGVVGFRRSTDVSRVRAVRWASERFGVPEVRLWVLLDKWGGYARAEIERVG